MKPNVAPSTARQPEIRGRTRRERGTVLMMFPAAVFILCVLGALAVDSANATMRRRALQSAADAAANDAAGLAIDTQALRRGVTLIDPDRARAVVDESLARQRIVGLQRVVVRIDGGDIVVVELEAEHPSVFARSIPGASGRIRVPARARAQAITSGEGSVARGP